MERHYCLFRRLACRWSSQGYHRPSSVLWALLVGRDLLALWLITLNQAFLVLYELSNVV